MKSTQAGNETIVARQALMAARLTWMPAALIWTGALIAWFVLTPAIGISTILFTGGEVRTALPQVLGTILGFLAIGTLLRALAWDEVGDRALAQSARVFLAFPLFALTFMMYRQVLGGESWQLASIAFGVLGTLAMVHAVHASVGSGLLLTSVARIAARHPIALAVVAGWLSAWAWYWHGADGAYAWEFAIAAWPMQLVCFAAYDDAVGLAPRRRRRTEPLGAHRITLPYAWPNDLARQLLVCSGLVRPGGQLSPGTVGGYTCARLSKYAELNLHTHIDRPGELVLGIHVNGSASVPGNSLKVQLRDTSGTVVFESALTTARPRLPLPRGRHHVTISTSTITDRVRSEVSVWWIARELPDSAVAHQAA